MVFLTTAGALGTDAAGAVATAGRRRGPSILLAISAGAVFMGAVTYIGNAPNFMVKNIAEGAGVKDAELLRLHRLGARLPDTGVHHRHSAVLPLTNRQMLPSIARFSHVSLAPAAAACAFLTLPEAKERPNPWENVK